MNTSTHTRFVTARPLLGECAMSRTMATVRGKVERNITQSTIMLYQNQRPTWRSVVAVIAVSVTRDMSGFGSTRSVRFLPEGSHAAGGQNGPDHRCDWVASSEEVELRRGGGAVGDERAALSPAARCL